MIPIYIYILKSSDKENAHLRLWKNMRLRVVYMIQDRLIVL